MDQDGTYIAFSFETNRKGDIINGDKQVEAFVNYVIVVRKKEPKNVIVGPLIAPNGQVRIKATEVYIQI